MMKILFLFFMFAICIGSLRASDSKDIVVGVYEDGRVRRAFAKEDGEWISAAAISGSSETNWTAVFSGEAVGTLKSKPIFSSYYSDAGLEEVTDQKNFHEVHSDAMHFPRWMKRNGLDAWPLILTTGSEKRDPEKWKIGKLEDFEKKELVAAYRHDLPVLHNCKDAYQEHWTEEKYGDAQLMFSKAFHSQDGDLLAAVFPKSEYRCDGPEPNERSSRWYFLKKGGKPKFLGLWLTPMDAVDLDGDGRSEWVFSYSGYNLDGYVLYWDDFSKSAEFKWNYH